MQMRTRWEGLVVVASFVWGCTGSGIAKTMPEHEFDTDVVYTCEEFCDLGPPPVPINTVVLTDAAGAPTDPTSFGGCTSDAISDEDEWPCVISQSLTEASSEGNRHFTADDGSGGEELVCLNPANINTCIRFGYGDHLEEADLPSVTGDCEDLVELSDTTQGTADYDAWRDAIEAALLGCMDSQIFNRDMANVFIMDNPWGSDDSFAPFGEWQEGVCYPVTFLDKDRMPDPTDHPFDFVDAANEHEMGHAYGVDHTCVEPLVNVETNPSNIMQTGDKNCCCECSATHDPGTGFDKPSSYWWTDVCNDCSETTTGTYTPPAACDDSPADDDDCDDCDQIAQFGGNREEPFTDDEPGELVDEDGDWEAGSPPGQVQVILANAKSRCGCACMNEMSAETTRITIPGEADCSAGSGRFAMLMLKRQDADDDDEGFGELVPVLISGNHLGRLAWFDSVDFVSFGDFATVVAPTAGHDFVFGTDPDDLLTTNQEVFNAQNDDRTFSMGEVGAGYAWGVEGLDVTDDTYYYPVVDLEWACNSDYGAPDVYRQRRPPGPYRLPVSYLYGNWAQELLLRPDYGQLVLWVEMRGYPRAVEVVPLTAAGNGEYDFSWNMYGLEMTGWVKAVGTPVGTKLRVHIDNADYNGTTWSNVTLTDLVKL